MRLTWHTHATRCWLHYSRPAISALLALAVVLATRYHEANLDDGIATSGGRMSVELHILSGARLGERLQVDAEEFQIGVGPGCAVAFDPLRDPQAAGCRVLLRREGDGWYVRNLGRPGAWVNQQPLAGSLPLRSGDVLRLSEDGPDLRFSVLTDIAGAGTGQQTGPGVAPRMGMAEMSAAGGGPPRHAAMHVPPVPIPVGAAGAAASGPAVSGKRQPLLLAAEPARVLPAKPAVALVRWILLGAAIVVLGLLIGLFIRIVDDLGRTGKEQHSAAGHGAVGGTPTAGTPRPEKGPSASSPGSASTRGASTGRSDRPQRRPEAGVPRSANGVPPAGATGKNKWTSAPLRRCVLVLALEPAVSRHADGAAGPDLEQLVPFAAACAVRHKQHVMLLTSGWTAYLMQQFWLLLDDAGRPRVRFFAISTQRPTIALEIERIFVHQAYARAHETLPDVPADAPANLGLLLPREPYPNAVAAAPHAEVVAMRRGDVVQVAAVLGVSATPDELQGSARVQTRDLLVRMQQAVLRRAAATREEAAPRLEITWPSQAGRPAEGTPVFDASGRLVGVCTAFAAERLTAAGVSAESLAALWEPDLPVMWHEYKGIVRETDLAPEASGQAP